MSDECLEAESGYCPGCEYHTIWKRYAGRGDAWYCFRCEGSSDELFQAKEPIRHGRIADTDPENIPPHLLIRDERHPAGMSGAQVEKEYHRVNAKIRQMKADGVPMKHRVDMRIPPEVYHARRKVDRDYWKDPKNVARERKVWGV